ncbi:hypothetical protein LZ198_19455 [Myxococcus sp. K15C18031901]|uniref:hypothetical protein n=1 Tax=Myxococcus dinghuensis TaxID=2906761 RepID=UPI0020A6EE05|nr:hypothetical protein [Myxococcus dinghuensis]MCP3101056.1 hypothetical protein [Myxococcus dinghuensis]
MKLDDLVLALTVSLLRVERERWLEVLSQVEVELGSGWTLRLLEIPGTYSVGARTPKGQELSLEAWRELLDAEGLQGVRAIDLGSLGPAEMPEHVAAAFINSEALVLDVRTRNGSSLYQLETVLSSASLMSPRQFAEFARLQPHAPKVMEALARAITESNQLNQRPAVAPSQVADYLRSREGAGLFDLLGGDLLRELQVTVLRQGAQVLVPEDHRAFFRTLDPDDFERSLLPPDRLAEFVPSDERLYLSGDDFGRDFVALVEAQPFADDIWRRAVENLNRFIPDGGAPHTPESLKALLSTAGAEAMHAVPSGNLMEELQMCCKAHGVEPVIPAALRERVRALGPTREAREKDPGLLPEREWMRLVPNDARYQLYLFSALTMARSPALPRPTTDARVEFLASLGDVADFAERKGSPFAEAFRLARFCLENTGFRLQDYGPSRVGAVREALRSEGFSERAWEVFERRASLVTLFQVFPSSEERLRGLLACSVADVFGGMGSWNDEFFETDDDQAWYERVTQQLFRALREFFVTMVNAR